MCRNSCFGRTGRINFREFKNAICVGQEQKLIDCNEIQTTGDTDCENAGVLCGMQCS